MAFARRIDRLFCQMFDTLAAQRRYLDDGHVEPARKLVGLDLHTAFLDDVHLVERDDHRDPELHELRRQIQVALQIGRVDDVDDGVGVAARKEVSRDDFLVGIRRKRVDAREVDKLHVPIATEGARLLFHGNARPISHILMIARELVEQRRLARVRVSDECNRYRHLVCHLSLSVIRLTLRE